MLVALLIAYVTSEIVDVQLITLFFIFVISEVLYILEQFHRKQLQVLV